MILNEQLLSINWLIKLHSLVDNAAGQRHSSSPPSLFTQSVPTQCMANCSWTNELFIDDKMLNKAETETERGKEREREKERGRRRRRRGAEEKEAVHEVGGKQVGSSPLLEFCCSFKEVKMPRCRNGRSSRVLTAH